MSVDNEVVVVMKILGWTSWIGATAVFLAFDVWAVSHIVAFDNPYMAASLVLPVMGLTPFWAWASLNIWRSRNEPSYD